MSFVLHDGLTEQIHASAVKFLLDGEEYDSANVLLACTLSIIDLGVETIRVSFAPDLELGRHHNFAISISAPRAVYDLLRAEDNSVTQGIRGAITAALPTEECDANIQRFIPRAQLSEITPEWRADLLEIARGKSVHNQGITAKRNNRGLEWNGLRFASQSELRIAKVLDQEGLLYFPNCMGRLGLAEAREKLEPDFLICQAGKWGFLEVDGEPFHPPTRTVHDHARDRRFMAHGIRLVQHFDAKECYEAPQAVVRKFLALLQQA